MSKFINTTTESARLSARRFGIVLVPGFSSLALAMTIEPLFVANWLARSKMFSWNTLSTDGFAVTASNGTQVPVDRPLGTTERFDVVLVLASFDAREATADTRLLKWLRWSERTGAEVGAVETGSEILAAAGMLENRDTPVHWYNIEGMRESYPDVNVSDALFTLTARRPISAGGSATLDMMIELVARSAGQELATEVAQHLLLRRRSGNERQQPSGVTDQAAITRDPVTLARQIMTATIDQPKSCRAIAEMVGLSERHLQRLFRQQLGSSVSQIYHGLRMERAHQLIQLTDLKITEVAVACGFSCLEVFSRAYKSAFNVAPSRDRLQSLDSSVFRLTRGANTRRDRTR